MKIVAVVALLVSTFAAGCSGGEDAASSQDQADFAAFASCMNSGGCTNVPSCPKGSTTATCHLESDSQGRLIALWSCPSGTVPMCALPVGDTLVMQ